MLLGLNLGLPLLVLAVALAQDRLDNWRPDWPARQRAAWRRTLLGCMLVATALTLVITWQKDFRAREERARIAETAQEGEEKARTERKEISEEIKELAASVGAMDPRLTDEQALSRIGLEILRLRERTSELEDELDGLKKYRSVARLNVLGLSGTAGAGLTESSALSRALEGAYETTVMGSNTTHRTKCDEESIARFVDVATKFPHFPFAHWAIAVCLRKAGNSLWQVHAERAMAILDHTTQISGRHSHHDEVRAQIAGWLLRTK